MPPGGLLLLRGRELAESHPESLSQPLARCLAVCEVLWDILEYSSTRGTVTATPPSCASHSGEQCVGGHHGKCSWPENFTKGNVSIVVKVNM